MVTYKLREKYYVKTERKASFFSLIVCVCTPTFKQTKPLTHSIYAHYLTVYSTQFMMKCAVKISNGKKCSAAGIHHELCAVYSQIMSVNAFYRVFYCSANEQTN